MNGTPLANRIHIGFFGKRNAGKSSLVNAITNQEISIVSEIKGTTTDPVIKTMELLPLGPVALIDTPGIDDEGILGELRIRKTKQVLNKVDIAVLVVDGTAGYGDEEKLIINLFKVKEIPYLIVINKSDLLQNSIMVKYEEELKEQGINDVVFVSSLKKEKISELKASIGALSNVSEGKFQIVGDLINPGDFIILVTPIDKAAPKGRLILPQQQTIRDILESDAVAIVVKEYELKHTLENLGKKPSLVITDSQVFAKVSGDTPVDIPLTSFSILMARYKGFLESAIKGVKAIEELKSGDKILIAEGCTHHRQCDDIGTVKIPRWLRNYIHNDIQIDFTSGGDFPEDLSSYKLIIHCGGCMLNEREIRYRKKCADDYNVPFTNFGIIIAYMQGILKRSVEILPGYNELIGD